MKEFIHYICKYWFPMVTRTVSNAIKELMHLIHKYWFQIFMGLIMMYSGLNSVLCFSELCRSVAANDEARYLMLRVEQCQWFTVMIMSIFALYATTGGME